MKVEGWGRGFWRISGVGSVTVVLAGPRIGSCGVVWAGPTVGGRDSAGFGPRGVGAGGCRRLGGVPRER